MLTSTGSLLTMLTILPSGFFSLKWSKKHAKTQTMLQIKSQRAALRCFALEKHVLTFGTGHVPFFFPAGNFHAGWWTQAFHARMECFPAVSRYTLGGLTALEKPQKILKPLRKNKFIWKPFKNSDGETAYITKNNEWLHVYQQLASKCAGNSGLNITNLNQRPFPGQI